MFYHVRELPGLWRVRFPHTPLRLIVSRSSIWHIPSLAVSRGIVLTSEAAGSVLFALWPSPPLNACPGVLGPFAATSSVGRLAATPCLLKSDEFIPAAHFQSNTGRTPPSGPEFKVVFRTVSVADPSAHPTPPLLSTSASPRSLFLLARVPHGSRGRRNWLGTTST